jgi:hypothetical protein
MMMREGGLTFRDRVTEECRRDLKATLAEWASRHNVATAAEKLYLLADYVKDFSWHEVKCERAGE